MLFHITHLRLFQPPPPQSETGRLFESKRFRCIPLFFLSRLPSSVSVYFPLMELLLVMALCGFRVFNHEVKLLVTFWQLSDLCVKMEAAV